MDMTIEEFCDKHSACADGRNWALSCGSTTMHELWLREDLRHEWRMWIMQRDGVMTRTECVRLACWSVRQIWPLLTDERSRKAIEVTEAFLEGKATIKEVEESAASAAAYAASYASYAASSAAQDKWLIENTKPNFAKE